MQDLVAAFFVIYYPTKENLLNIQKIGSSFKKSIIFDNSDERNKYIQYFHDYDYFSDGKNHGLAYAYNQGLSLAYEYGYKWIMIFDQDSDITNIKYIFEELNNPDDQIAVVAPFIQYGNEEPNTNEKELIPWTINSGSCLRVKLLKDYNVTYDDYYFLDRLDRDFCKQITNCGLDILRINKAVLKQNLGERYNNRNVHSPLRNYYIARNRLYYNHKFYRIHKRIIYDIAQTTKHLIEIILIKKETKENIKMILRGICDYHKGKGGIISTRN